VARSGGVVRDGTQAGSTSISWSGSGRPFAGRYMPRASKDSWPRRESGRKSASRDPVCGLLSATTGLRPRQCVLHPG